MLGRRRGWLIVAILAVMAMLTGIAFGDPARWIWWTVGFSIALACYLGWQESLRKLAKLVETDFK